MYQVIEPQQQQQWQRYYDLRWRVLRAPFQRPRGSELDAYDQVGQHRMVVNAAGDAIAIGRLHFNSADEAQIRFMAAAPEYRGQGHGVRIVQALEQLARKQGAKHVVINARDNTLGFYLKCGYQLIEPADTLKNPSAEHHLRKTFTDINRIIYRPEWVHELQQTWHTEIPISDTMGIHIDQYSGREIETSAILARNINVHGTMFAGSIYSLATLTCWGLLHLQLRERGLSGAIVLADGQIHYHHPVSREPRANSHVSQMLGDLSVLQQGKNARVHLQSQVFDGDRPVAEFSGQFVVRAEPRRTTA